MVVISCLNNLFFKSNHARQSYLEKIFPSYKVCLSTSTVHKNQQNPGKKPDLKAKQNFSLLNTFMKFGLDQTIGASINTIIFSIVMSMLKGAGLGEATEIAARDFWPVMTAGWKLWPAISVYNFGFVKTVEGRTMIGGIAGMAWGIYLSLIKS